MTEVTCPCSKLVFPCSCNHFIWAHETQIHTIFPLQLGVASRTSEVTICKFKTVFKRKEGTPSFTVPPVGKSQSLDKSLQIQDERGSEIPEQQDQKNLNGQKCGTALHIITKCPHHERKRIERKEGKRGEEKAVERRGGEGRDLYMQQYVPV